MKIRLVVLDFGLSERARRLATLATVSTLTLGTAAIAYANVPHTWSDGDTLNAADLNSTFGSLETRLGALEQAPTPIITTWASYTPKVTEGGTDAGETANTGAFWRRIGDTVEVRLVTRFSSCAHMGQLSWSLPPNVHFDAAQMATLESIGGGLGYEAAIDRVKAVAVTAQVVNGNVAQNAVTVDVHGDPGGGAACDDVGPGGDFRLYFAAPVRSVPAQ